MNKGLSKERLNRVKWASDDKFCQVKMFISEGSSSQIGKAEDHIRKNASFYSNEMRIDNTISSFGSKDYFSNSKPIWVPQIEWNCPPAFALRVDWQVVAGEESKERMTQNFRETRVQEALYPSVCAIPPSPRIAPEVENCVFDDIQALNIPLTPIEEEDSMSTASTPCANSVECNVPIESESTVNDKLHEITTGLDADVIATAVAAVSTLLKSNEKSSIISMIDPDLLIKILNEPKLVESLSKVTCSATQKIPNLFDLMHKPVSEPILSSNDHVSDTLFSPHIIQLSTTSSPNAKPRIIQSSEWATENLNLLLKSNEKSSMMDPDLLIKILKEPKLVESLSKVTCSATQEIPNLFYPWHKPVSEPILSSNDCVSDTLFSPHIIQLSTTSWPNAKPYTIPSSEWATETLNLFPPSRKPYLDTSSTPVSGKPVNNETNLFKNVVPGSSSEIYVSNASLSDFFSYPKPHSASSSIPASIKSSDNILDLSRKVLPSSSSAKFGSHTFSSDLYSQPDRISLKNPWILGMQSSQPLSVSSTRREDQSANHECQWSVHTQGTKDANYYKSLIRLHGTEGNVTRKQCTPQHQESAPARTCKFFNSSRGCRNGPSCPFEHVLLPFVRADSFLDTDRSKRLKRSTDIAGQM